VGAAGSCSLDGTRAEQFKVHFRSRQSVADASHHAISSAQAFSDRPQKSVAVGDIKRPRRAVIALRLRYEGPFGCDLRGAVEVLAL
jgi:hypothetical protein